MHWSFESRIVIAVVRVRIVGRPVSTRRSGARRSDRAGSARTRRGRWARRSGGDARRRTSAPGRARPPRSAGATSRARARAGRSAWRRSSRRSRRPADEAGDPAAQNDRGPWEQASDRRPAPPPRSVHAHVLTARSEAADVPIPPAAAPLHRPTGRAMGRLGELHRLGGVLLRDLGVVGGVGVAAPPRPRTGPARGALSRSSTRKGRGSRRRGRAPLRPATQRLSRPWPRSKRRRTRRGTTGKSEDDQRQQ